MQLRPVLTAAFSLALSAPLLLAAGPAYALSPVRPYDFDRNGHPDLVIGAPGLQVGSIRAAGGVVVLPASGKGLSTREQVLTQSTSGVPGGSEDGDLFGSAVASGDFDHDGYADLAVGQPGEDLSGGTTQGAVTVLYGSSSGLRGKRSVQLTQPGGPRAGAEFGSSLVAADLDGDGYADLAIGAPLDEPGRSPADAPASGTVTVVRGGKHGLATTGGTVLRGVRGASGYDRQFGYALAVGDVDGNGKVDLVVASAGRISGDQSGRDGSVSFCPAGAAVPSACRRLVHGATFSNIESLVVGNVSGSSRAEVVVGLRTDVDVDAGHLQVLSLSGAGTATVATPRRYDLSDLGVGDETDDRPHAFGTSLAIGDLNADGFADLVAGAPGEWLGTGTYAGRVSVVHGGAAGLQATGNATIDQNTPGVPGGSEYDDQFGQAVTLLDHDGDHHLDLTVGAYGENGYSGAVTTLTGTGTGTGFTTAGARTFGLSTLGYAKPGEARFGEALGR